MSGWTQLKSVAQVSAEEVRVSAPGRVLRVVGWTVPGVNGLTITAISAQSSIRVLGPSELSFFMGGFPMVGGFVVSCSAATVYYDGG